MKYTAILEKEQPPTGPKKSIPHAPVFLCTQGIEAKNLDDAWNQARQAWYILKLLGPDIQIADIKEGDWEPPPKVEEAPPPEEEPPPPSEPKVTKSKKKGDSDG